MRIVTCLFASLAVVGLTQALADDPATSSHGTAPASQPATQPPTAATTATTQPAAQSSTPVQSATNKTSELTAEEKDLLAHGYKLETRKGEHYFCHDEAETGTRFKQKVCATAAQLSAARHENENFTRDSERYQNATRPLAGGH